MNNIFNVRVRKLIKADLLEYVKYILIFLGLGFAVPVTLSLLFGRSGMIGFAVGGFVIDISDFGTINVEGVFNFFSFAAFVLFLFVSGIVTGAELPSHVRWGGSRSEYVISTVASTVIISAAFAPFLLILNMILNLVFSSESIFYNFFHIGGGDIPTLIVQFLMYISLFLLGYCIPLIWQRVGWLITIVLIVALVLTLGFLGINFVVGFETLNVTTNGDYLFEIGWTLSGGISAIIGMIMIAVLGVSTYLFE